MTAHPTQLRPNTPHIPIQHRPLPTHHHNPHIPILHTPLAATPLRRRFWQSLLHRLRKFTQPKISHNGVLYQTRWAQQVKHGSNGRQPWQEILSLKIATVLMHWCNLAAETWPRHHQEETFTQETLKQAWALASWTMVTWRHLEWLGLGPWISSTSDKANHDIREGVNTVFDWEKAFCTWLLITSLFAGGDSQGVYVQVLLGE